MEIVIKKGGLLWWKKFHFTVNADNGEILCRSRKFGTIDEIFYWLDKIKRSMVSGLGLEMTVEKHEGLDQPYFFHMLNIYEDDEVILWSENYHNRKDCRDAINLIKKNINTAKVTLP